MAGQFLFRSLVRISKLSIFQSTIALGSITTCVALVGVAANVMDVQDPICAISPQPSVSDWCGSLGLAGKPTKEERLAFEAVEADRRNCDTVRAFLQKHYDSPDADKALTWLSLRREEQSDQNEGFETFNKMALRPDLGQYNSREAAHTAALASANDDAAEFCPIRPDADLISTGADDVEIQCSSTGTRFECIGGFRMVCRYSRPEMIEVCG